MKQIIITATPTGEVTVEASGFKGKGCAEATAPFIKALGTATQVTHKPEFHQTSCSTRQTQTQTQGQQQ